MEELELLSRRQLQELCKDYKKLGLIDIDCRSSNEILRDALSPYFLTPSLPTELLAKIASEDKETYLSMIHHPEFFRSIEKEHVKEKLKERYKRVYYWEIDDLYTMQQLDNFIYFSADEALDQLEDRLEMYQLEARYIDKLKYRIFDGEDFYTMILRDQIIDFGDLGKPVFYIDYCYNVLYGNFEDDGILRLETHPEYFDVLFLIDVVKGCDENSDIAFKWTMD